METSVIKFVLDKIDKILPKKKFNSGFCMPVFLNSPQNAIFRRMRNNYSVLVEFSKICSNRSSHQRCSMKKEVLGNLSKFTGKHLCQSLFSNKVAVLRLLKCV